MASQKCGSVTSFRGKGKVRRIKLMLEETKFVDFFSQVGRTFEFDEVSVSKSEEFVCSLYGKDLKHVNDARAALSKTGQHVDDSLPPNKDSLEKHLLRANYQAGIHHRRLEPNPIILPPQSHGWTTDEDVLWVKWMDLLPAPNSVLELANCK